MANGNNNPPVRRFTAEEPTNEHPVATESEEEQEGDSLTDLDWETAALVNFNANVMQKAVHAALQVANPLKVDVVEFANKHEVMMQIRKDIALAIFNAAKQDMWNLIEKHGMSLNTLQEAIDSTIEKWAADLEKQAKEESTT